jgi:uncharacterized membrane protein
LIVVPAQAGTQCLLNDHQTFVPRVAISGLVALTLLLMLLELALAPLRPGGTWLALKALPLALLLPGAMRGARKPLQALALLLPLYAAEGIVRGWSEGGRHAFVAWTAAAIAALTFAAVLAWLRRRARDA